MSIDSERAALEFAIGVFEVAGVGVMALGGAIALVAFVAAVAGRRDVGAAYASLRSQLGRAILLGLELLIVSDIIRSVALEPSFTNIGTLALLIFVRTFLSWSLEVEIEGEWPWERARSKSSSISPPPDANE